MTLCERCGRKIERNKDVVAMYEANPEMKLREIAERFKLCPSRICQIIKSEYRKDDYRETV